MGGEQQARGVGVVREQLLCRHQWWISKAFQGQSGQAYLFESAVNVYTGPKMERVLMTGLHVVCDLYCVHCHSPLGWYYVDAYEESQKYKVGKFILEKAHMERKRH